MKLTKLDKAAENAILICMGAKPKEKILVVSDEIKRNIGLCIYENAKRLGFESLYVEMKARNYNGEEPPEEMATLMKEFDIVFCPTAKSLTHTEARRNASASGVRVATLPGITDDIMIRGLSADYNKIAERTIKLQKIFEKTKIVRVTSPSGTDISMDISARKAFASKGLFHNKGESGNLPTGETYVAPNEGKSNGIIVVDGSMAAIGMLSRPIAIEVKDGYAVKISGGTEAKKLKQILDKFGKPAYNIAEFGIGIKLN